MGEVRGPIAPKDPTAKRSGFYIMRNKHICGSPQPDGRGVCFIYEDSGRLEASAGLVGNVTDEELLKLMGTTGGFRTLVHSIGVSINMGEAEKTATFAFQMYGHKDPYVSGTTIKLDIPADGMEYIVELDSIDWSDDDNVPGQIRFEFEEAEKYADVSVILYLNDGYEAPIQPDDEPIDFNSKEYKDIIAKSLIRQGNNYRIKKALEKVRNGEDITVAFIGGSITQGAGAVPINTACYAYLTYEGIKTIVGNAPNAGKVNYVKAGVGGTPSELGIFRYETDVCEDGEIKPDIVVIEFAVNDEGDETKGRFYDSLVRRIYNSADEPAVILEFAVFANDWNLEERLCVVGETYDLPMVSARRSVVDQFYKSKAEGNVLSKNQFFYDLFHPTNAGHKIMADGIIELIKKADATEIDKPIDISGIVPPIGGEFENVVLIDTKHRCEDVTIEVGSFTSVDTDIQCVERNLDMTVSPEFSNNWMYDPNKKTDDFKPFVVTTTCKAFVLIFKDSASVSVGTAQIVVDGNPVISFDPHEVGWTHCDPRIVFEDKESKEHKIEIFVPEKDYDKSFTILGLGVVF